MIHGDPPHVDRTITLGRLRLGRLLSLYFSQDLGGPRLPLGIHASSLGVDHVQRRMHGDLLAQGRGESFLRSRDVDQPTRRHDLGGGL